MKVKKTMNRIRELIARSCDQFKCIKGLGSHQGGLPPGRYVAIDWTDPSISVQELFVRDGEVSAGQQFHDKWPEDVSPSDSPQQAGEWLRGRMRECGISAVDTVVSVPRRSVSLRLLELPGIDDDELASVVALQIESRPDLRSEGYVFDFLPLPFSSTSAVRHVLLASVPKVVTRQIDETLAAADLTVRASGVGELAIESLAAESDVGLTLNILANYSKVEFVLSVTGIPVASHSTRMPSDNPEEIAQLIPSIATRMIAALPEDLSKNELRRINLLGPHGHTLEQEVREVCGCPVALVGTPCDEAVRTLALLTSLSQGDARTVNFKSPRRSADPNRARRQQWARYSAGVAVLTVLLGYWLYDRQAQLQHQLVRLQASSLKQQELNDRGQKTVDAWRFVSDWQASSVNWADELHTFVEQLPEPGRAYLTRMQLEQPSGDNVPVIRADGLASEPEVAMALNRKLMTLADKYELQPHGIEPATRDAAFRSSFRVEALIQNIPVENLPKPSVSGADR